MYEGEVTELTPTETENPLSGYGKTIARVVVGLKTVKGTKQLRLDPSIYESMLKEKVVVGDVIYIEANTGAVKVPSFPSLCNYCSTHRITASRPIRRLRRRIRPRIRDLRPSPQRRRTQKEIAGSRYHPRGPRRRQRSSTGWFGHHERHGWADDQGQDGGH